AAGVVKSADRLAPGRGDIGEELVITGIGVPAHHRAALAEVERRGRRNAHFRRRLADALEEFEMLDLRMPGEVDLAGDLQRLGLGVDAVELDRRRADLLDAFQAPEEIEVPPRA